MKNDEENECSHPEFLTQNMAFNLSITKENDLEEIKILEEIFRFMDVVVFRLKWNYFLGFVSCSPLMGIKLLVKVKSACADISISKWPSEEVSNPKNVAN